MFIRKTLCSLILSTSFFAGIQSAQASLLDIAQSPLVFSKSVPPNLILTVDDSASMNYGFMGDAMGLEDKPKDLAGGLLDGGIDANLPGASDVLPGAADALSGVSDVLPGAADALSDAVDTVSGAADALSGVAGAVSGAAGAALPGVSDILPDSPNVLPGLTEQADTPRNSREAKSYAYNSVYYNPNVTYEAPPGYEDATRFRKALNNGYDASQGWVNLRNGYRVLWNVPAEPSKGGLLPGLDDILALNKHNYCYVYSTKSSDGAGDNEICSTKDDVYTAPADGKQGLFDGDKVVFRLAENPKEDFSNDVYGLSPEAREAIGMAISSLLASSGVEGIDVSELLKKIGAAGTRYVGGTLMIFTAQDTTKDLALTDGVSDIAGSAAGVIGTAGAIAAGGATGAASGAVSGGAAAGAAGAAAAGAAAGAATGAAGAAAGGATGAAAGAVTGPGAAGTAAAGAAAAGAATGAAGAAAGSAAGGAAAGAAGVAGGTIAGAASGAAGAAAGAAIAGAGAAGAAGAIAGGIQDVVQPKTCTGSVFTVIHNRFVMLGADCEVVPSLVSPVLTTYRVSLTKRQVPAYYYIPQKGLLGNTTGYELRWVDNDQQEKNFAIWYSFYRNRALAERTAAHIAVSGLSSSLQVSWQTVSGKQKLGQGANNALGDFTAKRSKAFLDWLDGLSYDGDTSALQRAVKNAADFALGNPYKDASGKSYSCQANYHIAFSDGMWNGAEGTVTQAVQYPMGSNGSVPPYLPFGDRNWDDATGNPTGAGSDPRNDPTTLPHLVNFFIAPGTLSGTLTKPAWNDDLGTYGDDAFRNQLVQGWVSWPSDYARNSDDKLYDLWQAAIKSRGELISTNSQNSGVLQRLRDRLGEWITATTKPEVVYSRTGAGASASGEAAGDQGSYYDVFENRTDVTAWSGDLIKSRYVEDGQGQIQLASGYPLSAARELSTRSADSRRILMGDLRDNGATDYEPLPFSYNTFTVTFGYAVPGAKDDRKDDRFADWEALNLDVDADSAAMARDQLAKDRIAYISGDQSREGKPFRVRGEGDRTGTNPGTDSKPNTVRGYSVLGDIVDSQPVWVGPQPQLQGDMPAIYDDKYRSDFTREVSRRDAMVYIGANDGMLHAFRSSDLREQWAFVPKAVIPNLYKLTGQSYQAAHQYYVDGTPTVADAKINGRWRTVLIGTLAAGGREIFALDITDPDNPRVLWEKTNKDKDYGDLGYTFSKPQVALLPGDNEGDWSVVVGNGYGNQDPKNTNADDDKNQSDKVAALMVISLNDGTLRGERVVAGDHVNTRQANGLSTPLLADYDFDGRPDFAYAGDLQGNMWRFSLHQNWNDRGLFGLHVRKEVGTIGGDFSSGRLFSIRDVNLGRDDQGHLVYPPITAQPSVTAHPSRAGYLITFGSGKYFEQKDSLPYDQRGDKNPYFAYAIWDKKTGTGDFKKAPDEIDDNRALVEQTLESPPLGVSSSHFRVITNHPVDWDRDNGWKIELQPAEMVISPVQTADGALVFSTFTPKDPCAVSYDPDDQDNNRNDNDEPGVWTYGVNPSSGGQTRTPWIRNVSGLDDWPAQGGLDVSGMNVGSLAPPTISGDRLFFGGKNDDGSDQQPISATTASPNQGCGNVDWCSWQILREESDL